MRPVKLNIYEFDAAAQELYCYKIITFSNITGGDDEDEFDIMNFDIEEKKPEKKIEVKKPEKVVTEKPIRKKVERVNSKIGIFMEDSIAELKRKIFVSTKIEMYKQHLFINADNPVPMNYSIDDTIVNIFSPIEYIDGIPISSYVDAQEGAPKIHAYDDFMTVGGLYAQSQNEYHLVSIDNYNFAEAATDKYKYNLYYYGCVRVFWPMMSQDVFDLYLKNGDIHKQYPELSTVQIKAFEQEQKVMSASYAMLHNPTKEFTSTKLNSNISTAIMDVESNSSIDILALFNSFRTSHEVPIVRYFGSRTVTKLLNAAGSNVQEIYDVVKNFLITKINETENIIFILHLPESGSKILIVEIDSWGKYSVRINWKDSEEATFAKTFEQISKVNWLVKKINNIENIFRKANKLQPLGQYNGKYSMLNINMYYDKDISREQFSQLRTAITNLSNSGIIAKRQASEPEAISFYMIKGMFDYEKIQLENSFDVDNYYTYLFDAQNKARYEQLFPGRVVNVYYRTTDIRIEIVGIRESEYANFVKFISTFLYSVFSSKTKTAKNVKADVATFDVMGRLKNKNVLKMLKTLDPQGFNMKQFNSDIVYSRICQKNHQPVPFLENEKSKLPQTVQNKLVKYWNYTNNEPMYYICPNAKYPNLTFTSGHPKGYCLPCCKKNEPMKGNTKKDNIYIKCLENHLFPNDSTEINTKYIMNYSKDIEVGRICKLPDILEKYLSYNLEDKTIISDSGIKRELFYNGNVYSVPVLLQNTKYIKIHKVKVENLIDQLKKPVWSYTKPGTQEITPYDVIKNPKLSPNHYNRIINADIKYPILIHNGTIIDGMHRLSRAYILKAPYLLVRYITNKQLNRSIQAAKEAEGRLGPPENGSQLQKVEDNKDLEQKKTVAAEPPTKKSDFGYYLFGVPQHHEDLIVGALYSILAALRISKEEYIKTVIRELPKHFNIMLLGELRNYFYDSKECSEALASNFLISDQDKKKDNFSRKWNEFFIEITQYVYDKYIVVLDNKTLYKNNKNVQEDMSVSFVHALNSISDIIPAQATIGENRNQYIILLSQRHKSKLVYSGDVKYYYPIFIFMPHIFSRTNEIDQTMYTQNDEIIKLLRGILVQTEAKQKDLKDEPNLENVSKHVQQIKNYYVNTKGMCYGILTTTGIFISIANSYIDQTNDKIKELVKNKFVRKEAFGHYSKLPKIKGYEFNKFIVFRGHIIGLLLSQMPIYFAPVPPNGKDFKNIMKRYSPKGFENVLILKYDPDFINEHILGNASVPPELSDARFRKIQQEKNSYKDYVRKFVGYFGTEYNSQLRAKLVRILKNSTTLDDIQTLVDNIEDAKIIQKDLLNNVPVKVILSRGYNFDQKTLIQISTLVSDHLSGQDQTQKIKTIIKSINKKIKVSPPEQHITALLQDITNPLYQNLLHIIYSSTSNPNRYTKYPNEHLYIN
jgi:hypothetical protein